MKLSEDLEAELHNGVANVCAPDSDLYELWAHRVARARGLETELADTKAQLEYVRATVRTQEETAQELEAEAQRLEQKVAQTQATYAKDIMPMIDNLSLHQAAVAQIRALCARQVTDPSAQAVISVVLGEIDKLLKATP